MVTAGFAPQLYHDFYYTTEQRPIKSIERRHDVNNVALLLFVFTMAALPFK